MSKESIMRARIGFPLSFLLLVPLGLPLACKTQNTASNAASSSGALRQDASGRATCLLTPEMQALLRRIAVQVEPLMRDLQPNKVVIFAPGRKPFVTIGDVGSEGNGSALGVTMEAGQSELCPQGLFSVLTQARQFISQSSGSPGPFAPSFGLSEAYSSVPGINASVTARRLGDGDYMITISEGEKTKSIFLSPASWERLKLAN
jgi:hypothetical protein